MPAKIRLHKTTGKSIPKVNSAETASSEVLDPESQQQFEIELCWCIQQLQRTLNFGKLNSQQVQANTKTLNSLMSNTTPFIKKRQLMRVTFGDYRSKMAEEDSKLSKAATIIKIEPVTSNEKSLFVKKSAQRSVSSDKSDCSVKNTLGEVNNLSTDVSRLGIQDGNASKSFDFSSSDNTFRFNFQNDQN